MLKKLFPYMGGYKRLALITPLLMILEVACELALPRFMANIVDVGIVQGDLNYILKMGGIMLVLGSLSCLGYGPLANVTIIGMQFLDFFDFLTNSVMMPIAAIATCLLVSRVIGMKRIEEEVLHGEGKFHRKRIFQIMVQYLCPVFAVIILISSVANAFGWISM